MTKKQKKRRSARRRPTTKGPSRKAEGALPPELVITILKYPGGQTAVKFETARSIRQGNIGIILVQAAAKAFEAPDRVVLSRSQVDQAQHHATVTRDYPAVKYVPAKGVSLCGACWDVYDLILGAEAFDMPPGSSPVPCSYHLDEDTRPIPMEDAIKQKNDQEGAPVLGDESDGEPSGDDEPEGTPEAS